MSPKTQKPKLRPLDPTRNASDLMGDTSGMTGITTGSSAATSSTPGDDQYIDKMNEPGGNLGDSPEEMHVGIQSTRSGGTSNDDTTIGSMSPTRLAQIADQGSEADDVVSNKPGHVGGPTPQMDAGIDTATTSDTAHLDESSTDDTPFDTNMVGTDGGIDLTTPAISGEQSISGDMSDPESGADLLANAHAVGTQLDEDSENPQELDIARDIDQAEESLRTH